MAFDKALLATGSRSRMLPIPGADLAGVATLRTIDDVDRIRAAVKNGGTWVVIGAGYIGLEVAAVLRALGLEVHVLEAADRVMSRTTGETISRFFEGVHRKHGVAIELNAAVRAISKSENGKFTVETDAGPRHADGVLVGIGGQPNVELAEAAGLDVANGIVVDDLCRTSAEGIFAAGDCTNLSERPLRPRHSPGIGPERDRSGQGGRAFDARTGQALRSGAVVLVRPIRRQVSDCRPVHGGRQGDRAGRSGIGAFSVAYLQAGRLIALDAINRPRDYMFARRLVPTPSPVDEAVLSDPDRDLKDAVAAS